MIINIRSLPLPNLEEGPSESMNLVVSSVVFAENSAYDEGRSGVSEMRRLSVSRSYRGRMTGKEGESEIGFEMVSTPGSLPVLEEI
jgi:hypothetical protein